MNWLQPLPVLLYRADGSSILTTHALFFILGAVAAAVYLLRRADKLGVSQNLAVGWVLWGFTFGLFGARLAFLLAYPNEWREALDLLTIWHGGLVSFGGLLFGGLYVWFSVQRLSKEKQRRALDAIMVSTLLAWAIGRWGNYYAVESVGVQSAFWSATYGRVPIQIFESLGCLVAASLLHVQLGRYTPGGVAVIGLLAYGSLRFVVDTWREEALWGSFHVSQWFALLLALVSFTIWWRFFHRGKKQVSA